MRPEAIPDRIVWGQLRAFAHPVKPKVERAALAGGLNSQSA